MSELERLQVPVDTVVGMDWGSFVGALWSAGWNSGQIRELIRSWDSLPRAKDVQNSVLWKKTWLVKHTEDGKPAPVEISEDKPYFGQIFFDLMVQEALWRSEPGARVPFREATGVYPFPEEQSGQLLLSTLVALRDTNGTAAERYQQKLWNRDSNLIILRPHSKPNPDSLFEAGIQSVQNKRTALGALQAVGALPVGALPATPLRQATPIPPPRFLYHPVFDSVSAEYQGHLESLWNPGDTGILGVRNFLLNLQEDASYRSLKLTLDTGSFLQINTESSPLLSLSFYVFGGTFLGINAAADVNFRFINQFGYNLNLTAFYGQGARGAEPNLRFERFFMRDGDFFVKAKVFEYEPLSFFQKNIYEEARLLIESGRNITLGVEKPLGQRKSLLQIAVEIERKDIKTGASYYVSYEPVDDIYYYDGDLVTDDDFFRKVRNYEFISLSSMFPYARWLWQSEDYNRWFASDGFMAELMGGFKAVSVSSYGQNLPLYVSTQGKLSITHPLTDYVSVSGGTEFGANFSRTGHGKIVLPGELYGINRYDYDDFTYDNHDRALDNRYRFAMGMGFYREGWQTPGNSSHIYGLVSAGISLQWRGSGIFLTGGFAKDGEPNPWSEFSARRLFGEPKIRIKTQIFDLVFGQSVVYSMKSSEKRSENHIFLNICGGIL